MEETYIDTISGKELIRELYYQQDNTNYRTGEYYTTINGKFHREDGPAVIHYNKNGKIEQECYYLRDQLHRSNGPAIIDYNEDGSIIEKLYFEWGKEMDVLKEIVIRGLEMNPLV